MVYMFRNGRTLFFILPTMHENGLCCGNYFFTSKKKQSSSPQARKNSPVQANTMTTTNTVEQLPTGLKWNDFMECAFPHFVDKYSHFLNRMNNQWVVLDDELVNFTGQS